MRDNIQPAKKIVAIYFLWHKGKVVYVGQTVNLFHRLGVHLSGDKLFDEYSYLECDKSELNKLEAGYIVELNPVYNTSLPNVGDYITISGYKKYSGKNGWEIRRLLRDNSIEPAFKNYYSLKELNNA